MEGISGKRYMFPNPLYVQKPIYNTAAASVFTFIGVSVNAGPIVTSFTPKAITIALTDPNGFTLTRTYKPFAMKTPLNGEQMVWASVNLYAGSTAAISFTDDFGDPTACTNTVVSINLTRAGRDACLTRGSLPAFPGPG